MLEPPNLSTATMLASVTASYGLPVSAATFLPLGNDATAWVYRLEAGQDRYFLKVRRSLLNEASLAVPRYLHAQGVSHIVAPLVTLSGALWAGIDGFVLVVYPFVDGRMGMQIGLSDAQLTEFGATLRRLHATALPDHLAALVKRESFQPPWSAMVAALDAHIGARHFDNPYEQALAATWQARREEILSLVARANTLGQQLAAAAPALVLCHADAHTANVLVDGAQQIWLVDWDEIQLAPKERDLTFVVDGPGQPRSRTTQLFFDGYGASEVDPLALAYYRYEWAVQEIGDEGERLFFKPGGAQAQRAAVEGFTRLFEAGRDVDGAHQAEAWLS